MLLADQLGMQNAFRGVEMTKTHTSRGKYTQEDMNKRGGGKIRRKYCNHQNFDLQKEKTPCCNGVMAVVMGQILEEQVKATELLVKYFSLAQVQQWSALQVEGG